MKPMKRAPVKSKYRSPILQCMCFSSKCTMEGSDFGLSCPIKCMYPKTKERSPFSGNPRICSCSVCKCKCTQAYFVSDLPRIKFQQSNNKNSIKNENNTNAAGFIGDMFASGMRAALSSLSNNKKTCQ